MCVEGGDVFGECVHKLLNISLFVCVFVSCCKQKYCVKIPTLEIVCLF